MFTTYEIYSEITGFRTEAVTDLKVRGFADSGCSSGVFSTQKAGAILGPT